jgi:hypothetical protein
MAESLKELAMRLKMKRNSQNIPQITSKKDEEIVKKLKEPEQMYDDDDSDEDTDDDSDDNDDDDKSINWGKDVKPSLARPVKKEKELMREEPTESKEDNLKTLQMEVELLQNDGRFRVELLHRLDAMTTALGIIAEVLVQMTDNGEDKERR